MTRTVGVLGSLCNPPHLGHLLLASEAAWQLGLDKVLLVPTGIPPHRDPPPESPELRTRLAAALVTCDPVLELCRIEADKQEPSYTATSDRPMVARATATTPAVTPKPQEATTDPVVSTPALRKMLRSSAAGFNVPSGLSNEAKGTLRDPGI